MSLSLCFQEAWRGIKAWWIPLCILAAVLVVISHSWLIQFLLHDELAALQPLSDSITTWHTDLEAGRIPYDQAIVRLMDNLADVMAQLAMQSAIHNFIVTALWLLGGIALLICALHVIMVIVSKASVQSRREDVTLRRDLPRTALFTLSYIVLALMKMLPIMCCCVLPGLYLYLRWYFTDFIITERSPNPFSAAAESWRLTRGNLVPLAVLFAITLTTHLLSMLTYGLAEIPFRPFEYTLRAAAYRQLRAARTAPPA